MNFLFRFSSSPQKNIFLLQIFHSFSFFFFLLLQTQIFFFGLRIDFDLSTEEDLLAAGGWGGQAVIMRFNRDQPNSFAMTGFKG